VASHNGKRRQNTSETSAIDATEAIAAERVFGEMRDRVLDLMRNEGHGKPWDKRTQTEQERVIQTVEWFCRELVTRIVRAVASSGRRVMLGQLESITVKDGR
jgi:hypothetical protein